MRGHAVPHHARARAIRRIPLVCEALHQFVRHAHLASQRSRISQRAVRCRARPRRRRSSCCARGGAPFSPPRTAARLEGIPSCRCQAPPHPIPRRRQCASPPSERNGRDTRRHSDGTRHRDQHKVDCTLKVDLGTRRVEEMLSSWSLKERPPEVLQLRVALMWRKNKKSEHTWAVRAWKCLRRVSTDKKRRQR
eukprot:4799922-Pleurochrysis_carterae.AAC.4